MKLSLQSFCRRLSPVNLILMAGLFWLTFSSTAFGADITLAWDAVEGDALAGYNVYYDGDSDTEMYQGTGAEEGDAPITVSLEDLNDPDMPQFTLTGLETGQHYYFSVTAFDTDGNETDFSEEVGVLIDEEGNLNVISSSESQTDSSTNTKLNGGNGGGCLITTAMEDEKAISPAGAVGILLLLGFAAAMCPGRRKPEQNG